MQRLEVSCVVRRFFKSLGFKGLTNEMQLFVLFIDSNTLHVSDVTRPSSGAQELCVQPRCRIQFSLILSLC